MSDRFELVDLINCLNGIIEIIKIIIFLHIMCLYSIIIFSMGFIFNHK